jgi:hypothetical protein
MIWREESDYARSVIEWLREFEHRTGRTIESFEPDSPEGESICRTYDVVEYPTIIALNDEGKMLQEWRGVMLPKIDDVSYYSMD